MKKRIFLYMSILALTAIFLSSILTLALLYPLFTTQMQTEIQSKAAYLKAALNQENDKMAFLNTPAIQTGPTRITLVAKDGRVLYDNKADIETMDNHLSRPEIAEASVSGTAQNVRLSTTLGSQTFYYALRLDDGTVVRLANTTGSIFSAFLSILPLTLLLAAALFLLTLPLAKKMTARIITPINNLSLENPSDNQVYDELLPLLNRIRLQNKLIKQQMAELRSRQEDFTAITSHMSEGLIILDAQENILTVNDSAVDLLSAEKRDSYLGFNILRLNRNLTLQRAARAALQGIHSNKLLNLKKRTCQLLANPVYEQEAVKGAILLILDVTEQHKAEKIRQEFSANVSHELKTPLTSISGYAELLKSGLVKTEDIPSFAQRIHLEAGRMIALVENILMLSGLEEKKEQGRKEKVNLLELAKLVALRLNPRAKEKNISIKVGGESLEVPAVKPMLDQLMFNLIDNAVKYNNPNGTVEISVFRQNGQNVLTVSDNGIGIPAEHQERVFERFYRVDKSHSKQTGGTGLGLSIVKHIAEYHRAAIKLESAANKGTKITVTFPAG
jgi:two-component system phosphate regulon sensor histidine kinase PhoR